eukprot:3243335-Rhodomonas_salina.2
MRSRARWSPPPLLRLVLTYLRVLRSRDPLCGTELGYGGRGAEAVGRAGGIAYRPTRLLGAARY